MRPFLSFSTFDSPIGKLFLCSSCVGLRSLSWSRPKDAQKCDDGPFIQTGKQQLREYFDGLRSSFDLKLDLKGSEFQIKVWSELARIPFGETLSYKALALRVGSVGGQRAVGGANAKNPLPIIVPCHRVISSNGQLGGYSSGVANKKKLLRLEGVLGP